MQNHVNYLLSVILFSIKSVTEVLSKEKSYKGYLQYDLTLGSCLSFHN